MTEELRYIPVRPEQGRALEVVGLALRRIGDEYASSAYQLVERMCEVGRK